MTERLVNLGEMRGSDNLLSCFQELSVCGKLLKRERRSRAAIRFRFLIYCWGLSIRLGRKLRLAETLFHRCGYGNGMGKGD